MAFSRKTLFYGLRESGGHVRYIGITTGELSHRLKQHISLAARSQEMHRPVYVWLSECLAKDIRVEIVKLAECEPAVNVGHWLSEYQIESCLIRSYSMRAKINGRPPILNATAVDSHADLELEAAR
jgi:hypothetical protein